MTRRIVRLSSESPTQRSRVLGPGNLEDLLDKLDEYGPETVGFVVDVEEGFREDVPEGWTVSGVGHVCG